MIQNRKIFAIILIPFLAIAMGCEKDDETNGPGSGNNNNGSNNNNLNNKAPGASAENLLSQKLYEKMKVELQYIKGYKPTDKALDNFKSFLKQYLHKPGGITFKTTSIQNPSSDNSYSVEQIKGIEDGHRNVYTKENTIGVYFLFVNGEHEDDTDNSKILGIAYRNTSMVIFEKTIQELSDEATDPSTYKLETAVINHEMGHNLGLVANGTPMQTDHKDEQHGNHCDNDSCLMHWTVKTGDFVTKLVQGGEIPELQQNCKNDLEANGGK